MKILKWIVIVLVSIIVLIFVVALFVKKDYAVEREVTIAKPKAQVFDYVKHLKNQNNYSVWAQKDPNMKKTFTGTDGTVGFVSAWDSDNKDVGKGEQEIKNIKEGERLDFELRFLKPFKATDNAYMTTEGIDSTHTKVKWGFDGAMPYPMNLMLLCMDMDKMLGDQLETGLSNLKGVMEK